MVTLKLKRDKTEELSGGQVMRDLLHHKMEFESYIGWPILYTDVIFSLLYLLFITDITIA